MKTLLNYQILDELGKSLYADVFKAYLTNTPEQLLVLKVIKPRFISSDLISYLQQQIEQLTALELPHSHIPKIDNPNNETLLLVQPFIEGQTLSQWLANPEPKKLEDLIQIAINLSQCLIEIHKTGHIHKAIKPNNILIQPNTLKLRLIDDVRVLDINQISHFIYDNSFRVHTLPYLSPEQTGRIKYSVNYTTDLYSLGMVLYECLTNKPAFLFDDPVSIIHSHLAENPKLIHETHSQIPEILSQLVSSLIEKAPEKRYQTASGLLVDLQHCLQCWQQQHAIPEFTLKQRDYSNRITIPSLMVGRDNEKQCLLAEYQKSCAGVFRSALISGLSGIGKTRLIQELQLPIVSHYGYFCSGKFDQYRKHIPYSTLIQAFTSLIKTLLTEDSERINYWQQRINAALGENGQLMTDLIPELTLIIGEQTDVADLPPVEARNRFNDTAGKFIACLACKEHPLTLFIDDLQWCDGATFDLLELIFDNLLEYPYLFWLGAYRHNEVDEQHRLSHLIEKVNTAQQPLLEIRLQALGVNEVNQMTAYILNTYPPRTKALSEVIYHTSAGNPLFVNESLRWLHNYRHLHLNDQGVWSWDDEQLRHARIPDSALDLFKDKISKLSTKVQYLLSIAASLGANFAAADLAIVAELSLNDLYAALNEALSQNILLREKQQLYFFHDQVQAAAASFMNAEKKRQIHRLIAQAFIRAIPKDEAYTELPNLFSIVEHLNESHHENDNEAGLLQASKFNYAAGVVAMKSLAMNNANYFFHQAKQLYPNPCWEKDYVYLFPLYKHVARTEMALGNQAESEVLLNTLIQHSNSDLDRADCLYEQTTGLSSLGNFTKAIELGNRGLDFFQRRIPENDQQALSKAAQIFEEIHQNETNVWQQILDVDPSNDRATQIETGIYSELIPDYYLAGMVPQLYLSAIQSTQNCLAGGVDESVIYGFSMVGLYLQRQGRYQLSFRYEDLGLALAARYPDTFGATKGINGILWTNMHNRRNSEHILEQCKQNIQRGKNCGDLYNAGLSYGPYIWHLITQGNQLTQVNIVADECIQFSKKFNLSLSLGLAESVVFGWCQHMIVKCPVISETEIQNKLKCWEQDKHVVSIGGYYTLSGISQYYLGNYQTAAQHLNDAEAYLRGLSDNILNRLWYVFRYINSIQLQDIDDKEQMILNHCLESVKNWARLGDILKPYYALMLAEQALQYNNFSESRRYYLDAIDSSSQQKYLFLEAYLQERFAHLLAKQHHRHANMYLTLAVDNYQSCGADVKAEQLIKHYSLVSPKTALKTNGETALAHLLDVNYLLKATREITQQLDLKELLQTIIQAVMERLSAKTGYLLIVQNDKLDVLAKGSKQDSVEVFIKGDQSINCENLNLAIVNYVYRTQEMLVLDNACYEGHFIADEQIIEQQLKSVLCFPLIKQQQVLGVLFLENNLIKGVFSQEQIELTRLLTAQAAIALENTLLMQKTQQFNEILEQRVTERTESLNKVNEELNNFAYVVSHDLKAPLRAISQLSTWIEEDYSAAFDDDGREQMQLLRNRAKRMHEMIDGILQYSRIGRVKQHIEPVELNKLLEEIVDSLSPPEKISFDIQENLPIVLGERIRIQQVIQNLLDNAIKYNDKQQGLIKFSYHPLDDAWQFCIEDNGPGIDIAYQQKIFQLFQTLSSKDHKDNKGTGIGLSLIEKIISNWGGKIWLESEQGKGCQFFFTLPKKQEKQ